MAKKSATATAAEEVPANSFQAAILPVQQFAQDSIRLVKRCTKPDAKGPPSSIALQSSLVGARDTQLTKGVCDGLRVCVSVRVQSSRRSRWQRPSASW